MSSANQLFYFHFYKKKKKKKTWEAGSRDGKMTFNEKPLTLNDQLDSFVARRLTQDDTIAKKLFTMSTDELESKR